MIFVFSIILAGGVIAFCLWSSYNFTDASTSNFTDASTSPYKSSPYRNHIEVDGPEKVELEHVPDVNLKSVTEDSGLLGLYQKMKSFKKQVKKDIICEDKTTNIDIATNIDIKVNGDDLYITFKGGGGFVSGTFNGKKVNIKSNKTGKIKINLKDWKQ